MSSADLQNDRELRIRNALDRTPEACDDRELERKWIWLFDHDKRFRNAAMYACAKKGTTAQLLARTILNLMEDGK